MATVFPDRVLGNPAKRGSVRGVTLVEMLIALSIFTVGVLALLPLVSLTTRQVEFSRYQTTATSLAEKQLEQITYYVTEGEVSFTDVDGNLVIIDCGNAATSCGNSLNAVGSIDFSATAPAGFSATFQDGAGVTYDIRWNVLEVSPADPFTKKQIVVGVQAQVAILRVPPVGLRALMSRVW